MSSTGPEGIVAPWFRLGYVVPHLYTDMDAYQFYEIAPDGVMLVTTQMDLTSYSLAAVEDQMETFWSRVDVLAEKGVDVISLSGVPIASVLGRDRVLTLLGGVTERAGVRADTDLEAHIAALRHLGISKLALATRWPDDVVDALSTYLAAADIEVVGVRSHPRNLDENKRADPGEDHLLLLALGREVMRATPEAEGLMIPGGLGYAVHAAPMLEREFGVPVTLNVTATLWSALRGLDLMEHHADPRWGRLLADL